MNPRTFLPAARLAVASPPAIGDLARPLPAPEDADRPAVIAFLRHAGCPFAEQTVQLLRAAADGEPSIRWLAISHADERATSAWLTAVGGSGAVEVISDPSRRSYAAWGLGQTNIGHFLGRRSLAAVAALARTGIRNRHPSGTRWQSAGTFAVDRDGRIAYRHLPSHAGELPDLRLAGERAASGAG